MPFLDTKYCIIRVSFKCNFCHSDVILSGNLKWIPISIEQDSEQIHSILILTSFYHHSVRLKTGDLYLSFGFSEHERNYGGMPWLRASNQNVVINHQFILRGLRLVSFFSFLFSRSHGNQTPVCQSPRERFPSTRHQQQVSRSQI